MDSAAVRGLLVASLDHNTDARRQAELSLKQVRTTSPLPILQPRLWRIHFNTLFRSKSRPASSTAASTSLKPSRIARFALRVRIPTSPAVANHILIRTSSRYLYQEPRQPLLVRNRRREFHITRGREGPRTGTPRPAPRPVRAHRSPAVDTRPSAYPSI